VEGVETTFELGSPAFGPIVIGNPVGTGIGGGIMVGGAVGGFIKKGGGAGGNTAGSGGKAAGMGGGNIAGGESCPWLFSDGPEGEAAEASGKPSDFGATGWPELKFLPTLGLLLRLRLRLLEPGATSFCGRFCSPC